MHHQQYQKKKRKKKKKKQELARCGVVSVHVPLQKVATTKT
jgi:hypothetical protein